MSRKMALLLDIDGVLVYEAQEIIRLHRHLAGHLWQHKGKVFVVTHRSRREAAELLRCAGVDRGLIEHCFTADDILTSALMRWRIPSLLRQGLRKSLILPRLQALHGIEPGDVCFVDDRAENIHEMLAAGIGYGLLAPSELRADGTLVTFDFGEVLARYQGWAARRDAYGDRARLMENLRPREQRIEGWCRTGANTRESARSLFSVGRRVGRSLRRVLG